MSEHEHDPATTPSTDTDGAGRFTVTRDEHGDLLPVEKHTSFGPVEVYPMAYGAVERHFGDAGEVADIGSDKIAELFEEYVSDPDFAADAAAKGYDGLTGEYVRSEFKPMVPRDFILALLEASDVDADVTADADGGAQVALDEGNPR